MSFRIKLPSPLKCLKTKRRPLGGTLYLALAMEKSVALILVTPSLSMTEFRLANPAVPISRPTKIRWRCVLLALSTRMDKLALKCTLILSPCEVTMALMILPYNPMVLRAWTPKATPLPLKLEKLRTLPTSPSNRKEPIPTTLENLWCDLLLNDLLLLASIVENLITVPSGACILRSTPERNTPPCRTVRIVPLPTVLRCTRECPKWNTPP